MPLTIPRITWGAAFANPLNLGYPLDEWRAYPKPRAGYDWVQGTSGIEDAWTVGTDQYLEGIIRWIPRLAVASPLATGWEDANGVADFLAWARDKNQFRWIPDAGVPATFILSYLVEPLDDGGLVTEGDGTRSFRIVMRNPTTRYTPY